MQFLWIVEIGGRILDHAEDERERQFLRELEEAVANAEAKAEREKQRALMKLRQKLEAEKEKALQTQKDYFQELAKRVAELRDRLVDDIDKN